MNDRPYDEMDPQSLARLLEHRLSHAGAHPDALAKARAALDQAQAEALRLAQSDHPSEATQTLTDDKLFEGPHAAGPVAKATQWPTSFDGETIDARTAAFLDVLRLVLAHPGVQAAMKFAAEAHFAAAAIPNQWPLATASRPNPPAPPKPAAKPAAPPPKLTRWRELGISQTTYKRLKKRGALA